MTAATADALIKALWAALSCKNQLSYAWATKNWEIINAVLSHWIWDIAATDNEYSVIYLLPSSYVESFLVKLECVYLELYFYD